MLQPLDVVVENVEEHTVEEDVMVVVDVIAEIVAVAIVATVIVLVNNYNFYILSLSFLFKKDLLISIGFRKNVSVFFKTKSKLSGPPPVKMIKIV